MESRKIQNYAELARTPARAALLSIAEAGLRAINTPSVLRREVALREKELIVKGEVFSLEDIDRILVVGAGKCSLEAARTLEEILGDRISGGVVIDVQAGSLKRIQMYAGDHPFPTERNVSATRELIALLSGLSRRDLVLVLISGGGSTLLCAPRNMQCAEEAELLKNLFRAGADIREINTVRKHLSLARGGYLAKYAFPARVVSLIFSDVPGDDLSFVASGPTVRDTTTIADAEAVLDRYEARTNYALPKASLIETPKDEHFFTHVHNILIVSNMTALRAMHDRAEQLGFIPVIKTHELRGEARDVALQILKELRDTPEKTVLLYGGETTVTIRGGGKGGRNEECVLSALREIREGEVFLAIASDGRDNTDFAGAICDIMTRQKAKTLSLDLSRFLEGNDTYSFFSQVGDFLKTGETGSNVSDLILAFHE